MKALTIMFVAVATIAGLTLLADVTTGPSERAYSVVPAISDSVGEGLLFVSAWKAD